MGREQELEAQNKDLRDKLDHSNDNRRKLDEQDRREVKDQLSQQGETIGQIHTLCKNQDERSTRIERRLRKGDKRFRIHRAQMVAQNRRIEVLERDHKFRVAVRKWAIRFCTAIGLSGALAWLKLKE